MSDPMSSGEIEDVLSSIRRLVSEDLRPAAPPQAPTAPETGSKLILTPALRVISAMPEPAPAAPTSWEAEEAIPVMADEAAAEDAAQDGAPSIETVVASVGAAVAGEDWEPDEPEAEGWSQAGWDEDAVIHVDLDNVDEAEVVQFTSRDQTRMVRAWHDGAWAEPAADADFSEKEVDIVEAMAAWAKGRHTAADPQAEPVTEAEPEIAPEPEPETAVEPDILPEPEIAPAPEFISAPLPEPEVLDDQKAADVMSDDRAEAEALAEIIGADAEAAVMEAVSERVEERIGMFDEAIDDAEAGFDEEALRELVREIIREELAGSLGERMTRNVRKLVRVEVNRALSSREFS